MLNFILGLATGIWIAGIVRRHREWSASDEGKTSSPSSQGIGEDTHYPDATNPRTIWDLMSDVEQQRAVRSREPVEGVTFRCTVSTTSNMGFVEADDGTGWKTVTLAPKRWNLQFLRADEAPLETAAGTH